MGDEIGALNPDDLGGMVIDSETDDINPDENDVDDKTEGDGDGNKEDKKTGEIDDLKKQIEEASKLAKDTEKSLKSELEDLRKENNRLGYALRKAETKEPVKEDETFTDAQLLQMMKDNSEDPEILFQIVKQMQKQSGALVEKSAEKKIEIQNKRKELYETVSSFAPGIFNEGTPVFGEIEKTKTYLDLGSNPYGDVLALGVMNLKNMPNIIKNVKEQTKKEVLAQAAEEKRKGKIKSGSLADKGEKDAPKEKTPNVDDTVSQLGMNKKQIAIYKRIMSKKDKNLTALAEK